MDEVYIGFSIVDSRGVVEIDGYGSVKEEIEVLFVDLLKDENEGLVVKIIFWYKYYLFFIGGCVDSIIFNFYLVLDNGLYKWLVYGWLVEVNLCF